MSERRSGRLPTVSSPLTLLRATEPVHHAICGAMAEVQISGSHYQALVRASDALHRLAADLGHPGHFAAKPPHL